MKITKVQINISPKLFLNLKIKVHKELKAFPYRVEDQ